MPDIPDSVAEIVGKVSQQPGTIEDYEKLNILLRNLSQDGLETAVSEHNLLNIFGHMDLSNGFDLSKKFT